MLTYPHISERAIVIIATLNHSFLKKIIAIPIPVPKRKVDSLKPNVTISKIKYNFNFL